MSHLLEGGGSKVEWYLLEVRWGIRGRHRFDSEAVVDSVTKSAFVDGDDATKSCSVRNDLYRVSVFRRAVFGIPFL